MARVLTFALGLGLLGTGVARAEGPEALVSAASSLKAAMADVVERYTGVYPGTRIALNTASSGVLARQIEHGAPVDLFVSASPVEVDRLDDLGLVRERAVIAGGVLVVVVPAGRSPPEHFADVAAPRFRRVALGNPGTVPAGRYARQALRALGVWDALEPRAVLGENVRQVLDWVARGEVDAGLVYATDAALLPRRVALGPAAPPGSHAPIVYEAAVPEGAPNPVVGGDLLRFLGSEEGREILSRRGFTALP